MNLPCVSFFDIYKSTTGMRSVESLQNHHWALKPYAYKSFLKSFSNPKNLRCPACSRQKNATFSPHFPGTWGLWICRSLYNTKCGQVQKVLQASSKYCPFWETTQKQLPLSPHLNWMPAAATHISVLWKLHLTHSKQLFCQNFWNGSYSVAKLSIDSSL